MGEYRDLEQYEKKLRDNFRKIKNNVNSKNTSNQNSKVTNLSKEDEFEPSDEYEKDYSTFNDDFEPISEEDNFIGSIEDKFEPLDETDDNVKDFVQKNNYQNNEESGLKKETGKILKLKNSNKLAEMIGIALGDGNIPKSKSQLRITLNKTEDPLYTHEVYDLMQKVFNEKPSIYEPKDANAVKISINRKRIVENLIDKGLIPGDKKINQVDIPQWVKNNKNYLKSCLRGLVDTDGSIHVHKSEQRIRIGFKNASYPLMKDFKEVCEFFDIKTGKIYPVKGKNIYEIQIETKDDLCKFLVQIKPRKWKYRTEIIGLVLKSIRDPEKRAKIENELFEVYPDKKVHNTIKYKDFLRNLCEKYGYDVSIESIVKEVENALFYNENYKGLSNKQKKELNIYAKQIIDNLKRRLE